MSSNGRTRILHTADTHIGYRQYHRQEREDDYLQAFTQLIDAAIEQDVDAVVHAGDLFDSSRPSTEPIYDVLAQLKRLVQADIPFLSVVGNHDGRRGRQWLDIFEDIGYATRLGKEGTTVGSIELYGLDHVSKAHRDELTYEYEDPSPETKFTSLVAHGLFTPFPNGNWDSETIVRTATIDIDMILAGDDHTPQSATLDTDSNTQLTYPGSTERTAADQREPRGYHLITFDPEGNLDGESPESDVDTLHTGDTPYIQTKRDYLDTRPFEYIDIELESHEGTEHVLDIVRKRTSDLSEKVLIVTLEGDGERVPVGPIEEYGLENDALVVRVNDRREFEDEIGEYNEVSFADPETAVDERKAELNLSKAGSELEELVRSGSIASSNIKSASEDRVKDWINDRPLSDFQRKESSVEKDSSTDSVGSSDAQDSDEDSSRESLDDSVVEQVEEAASPTDGKDERPATQASDNDSSVPGSISAESEESEQIETQDDDQTGETTETDHPDSMESTERDEPEETQSEEGTSSQTTLF